MNKKMVKYFHTASITIQVNSDYPIGENTFHPKFKLFETMGTGSDNVIVNHHFYLPNLLHDPELIKNEIYKKDQWHIYKTPDSWIYRYNPVFPEAPQHSATGIFNLDHTVVDIYTNDFTQAQYQDAHLTALTLFNTDQILFAKLLCNRNGLIIHSNGFDILGNGVLLAGESGVGKSTLSAMLQKQGFQILCDDRMFVIHENNKFTIHGNWCHGTIAHAFPGAMPLRAIFFLEPARKNSIEQINNKNSIFQKIIHSMVKSTLNQEEWEKMLTILETIMLSIPCYNLKFDLSGKICQIITDMLDKKTRDTTQNDS